MWEPLTQGMPASAALVITRECLFTKYVHVLFPVCKTVRGSKEISHLFISNVIYGNVFIQSKSKYKQVNEIFYLFIINIMPTLCYHGVKRAGFSPPSYKVNYSSCWSNPTMMNVSLTDFPVPQNKDTCSKCFQLFNGFNWIKQTLLKDIRVTCT